MRVDLPPGERFDTDRGEGWAERRVHLDRRLAAWSRRTNGVRTVGWNGLYTGCPDVVSLRVRGTSSGEAARETMRNGVPQAYAIRETAGHVGDAKRLDMNVTLLLSSLRS